MNLFARVFLEGIKRRFKIDEKNFGSSNLNFWCKKSVLHYQQEGFKSIFGKSEKITSSPRKEHCFVCVASINSQNGVQNFGLNSENKWKKGSDLDVH